MAGEPPTRYVYDISEADPENLDPFGGKGAGIARMSQQGLPVPPALVITTDAYRAYRDAPGTLPAGLAGQIDRGLRALESATGRSFSGDGLPLLVSVRSGAKVSMPGMMDTILNLGLEARSVEALAEVSGDRRFAIDSWLCFWNMYGDIVLGLDPTLLAEKIDEAVAGAIDSKSTDDLQALESAIVATIQAEGESPPITPRAQLDEAIAAVFDSWDSRRARAYREHHGIAHDLGTAVVIQAMVFGNLNKKSGSGVAFTRNPIDGSRVPYGEYVIGRQGEELVSGATTPISLAEPGAVAAELKAELERYGETLETLYRDALDIEFTVEDERLYLLQVRPAKRTAEAAVRITTELADAGVLSRREALARVEVDQIKRLLRPVFDLESRARADRDGTALVKGIGASPGHASGFAILDADRAAERAAAGEQIILVRPTTSPQDVRGMLSAQGVVTARGGSASHAAVVSRALDKPCVVGCGDLTVDLEQRSFQVGTRRYLEGEPLSIDGQTGDVYATEIPLTDSGRQPATLSRLLDWADEESDASIWLPVRNSHEVTALSSR